MEMYASDSSSSLGYNPIDVHLKEFLHLHRNKFAQIDVERLIPFLKDTNILTQDDIDAIRRAPGPKINTLLDLLPSKGPQAFQTLCLALENTSPHLLTVMLMAASQRMHHSPSRQGSMSAGLTSDSECEDKKSTTSSIADRPPSSSPPQGNVVSSHDYNMEQSNVALLRAELKIVTKDRDMMKKELKKTMRERDDALNRYGYHHVDQSSGYSTLTKHGSITMSESVRDIDNLKLQYEKAIFDMQSLKKDRMELNRKLDTTLKDVDYYKNKERSVYSSLQNLRIKFDEVCTEKQRLEQELSNLQVIMDEDRKEIVELRRQQQETMAQEGSGDALNHLYITTLRKYEALKDEYDSFRKRYTDIAASHSSNISKLELSKEEVSRLQQKYEEVQREKNCLKKQCTDVLRNWDVALKEKTKLEDEMKKMKGKHDDALKDMNVQLLQRQNLGKDLKRLQEERNAAMQEYTLVMSERDCVHKEIEKLQEELSIANKAIKSYEQSQMDIHKENESLQLELETLKREISSSLHDRDKAIRELNEIRERYGAKDDTTKEWDFTSKDYDTYKSDRDHKHKEGSDSSISHDMYSKTQKDRLDNLDQANQEIDRLRKTTEKLQSDLQELEREAEVCKRRRDWAFSERDKIVLERESIRAHCDILRHERDRAVSDLAEALRESDDMTKQRNEADKQLKELKEKLETEQEKSAAAQQLAAHNNSRDSAIDTDMHEFEVVNIQMQMNANSERDVGFEICGGSEDPHYGSNDGAFFVSYVTKDGPFSSKLRLHDQLLQVNGVDCQGSSHQSVMNAVLNGRGFIHMTVRRRRSNIHTPYTATIHCPRRSPHGITVQYGVYIDHIVPGSPTSKEGSLQVGDRIISVNGRPVENIMNCDETQNLLDTLSDIQITVLKFKSTSLSAPLSSSSSNNMVDEEKSLSNYNNKDRKEKSGPWGPLINIVKPRRHSKERPDKEEKKKNYDIEQQNALAELDSVLDACQVPPINVASTAKRKNKDKSGGTWPKCRGSLTLTEMNSNTIKPLQWRKERPPISILLPVSTTEPIYYDTYNTKNTLPRNFCSARSTPINTRNTLSIFKSSDSGNLSYNSDIYASISRRYSNDSQNYPTDIYGSLHRNSEQKLDDKDRLHSSTDTSLDFSVRSGNVGKDELENYVKSRGKFTQSDSDGNLDQPSSLPLGYSRPSPLPHLGDRIPSNPRIPHSHYGLYSPQCRLPHSFSPYQHIPFSQYTHSHPHTSGNSIYSANPHYSTPVQSHYMTPSRSGESIISSPGLDRDPRDPRGFYEYQISASPHMRGFQHSASPSMDGGGLKINKRASSNEVPNIMQISSQNPYYEYRKAPRKEERIRIPNIPDQGAGYRIPSSLSVSQKNYAERGSEGTDIGSERASPSFSIVSNQQLNRGSHVTEISLSAHNQHLIPYEEIKSPQSGDIRNIYIEKESEPLGFQIRCLEKGGVFVSSVTANSLAEQAGVCVGDQLLEVCGINMRSAIKQLQATTVLSQCSSSVTMLVQYNPEKYYESESWNSSESVSRSGSPTPKNSPKYHRKIAMDEESQSASSTLRAPLELDLPSSARSTLSRPQTGHLMGSIKRQETLKRIQNQVDSSPTESRRIFVCLKRHSVGIQMVGGNAVGIFVHSVLPDSPAASTDLKPGDRILEYNDVDLRNATAEQAALELAKPAENVSMLVKYDFQAYTKIKDSPGDSFYIRAYIDRLDAVEATDLKFNKEDILYVDNTMYGPGIWRAWLLDADGKKQECGTIPSKEKVEEEVLSQRNNDPMDRRGSTTARRSFFRRKKHSRSSSKDSKELASYSDASLNYEAASDDPLSYIRVERLDYSIRRPLVLVGPFWARISDRLSNDFPLEFARCIPKTKFYSQSEMESDLQRNIVESRRKGKYYEVTYLSQIQEFLEKNVHSILDISLGAVERLYRRNIYPIVLLLKFKHYKHIREFNDTHFSSLNKMSQKDAKEMFDSTNKLEQDYKHLISGTVVAGVNLVYVCSQIHGAVQREQSKTLWIPSGVI